MRILFDQGTPAPPRRALAGHEVSTAYERGWSELNNGDLLQAAEEAFNVFITTDRIRYQQNLSGRKLAMLVLPTTSWPRIRERVAAVVGAIETLRPGDVVELTFE